MRESSLPIEGHAKKRITAWAVCSLVLAILALFLGMFVTIPAIVCGHIARFKVRKGKGLVRGARLAFTGLLVGYAALFLQVVVLSFLLRSSPLLFRPKFDITTIRNNVAQAMLAPGGMSLDELGRLCFEPLIPDDTGVGIVVGTILGGEKEVDAYGNPPFSGHTVFEIGSATKVFTCLALSVLAESGQVELSDPIEKFLPRDILPPTTDLRDIQLVHLATHTSGLPRLPPNLSKLRGLWFGLTRTSNPYAEYDIEKLYAGLRRTKLKAPPGARYEYSNFGVGLLGQLLANAAGAEYETVIRDRVCTPLNMASTGVTLAAGLESAMAPPCLQSGKPSTKWILESLAGAGGLRSNVNDLLSFLEAHLHPLEAKLGEAIEAILTERFQEGKSMSLGLGWHCKKEDDHTFWWHNGGTGGYSSFIGIGREADVAVAVLGNADFHQEMTQAAFEYLSALTFLCEQLRTRQPAHAGDWRPPMR